MISATEARELAVTGGKHVLEHASHAIIKAASEGYMDCYIVVPARLVAEVSEALAHQGYGVSSMPNYRSDMSHLGTLKVEWGKKP